MSSVMLATGSVRAIRPLGFARGHERHGEVWGTEVSVLTGIGDVLGETLKVTQFVADEADWTPELGKDVALIVEVDTGRYGLQATFKRLATKDDVSKLPFGVPSLAGATAN